MNCPLENKEPTGGCRSRLIQAATDAFLEEGYRASVDRIAARAGVAKQTLYNNFTNKEELFREVGKLLADSIGMELCLTRDGLSQTLYNFGMELRNRTLTDKGLAIYRSFHIEAARVPEMAAAIHGRVVARLTEIVAGYLKRAMDKGEIKQDEPEFAAEMFLSMLIHADRGKRLAGDPQLSPEVEQQRVKKIVATFLTAYQAN
jgi:AcrR family transcriptional regulator